MATPAAERTFNLEKPIDLSVYPTNIAQICLNLDKSVPRSAVDLGKASDTSTVDTYRALVSLEQEGIAYRTGRGFCLQNSVVLTNIPEKVEPARRLEEPISVRRVTRPSELKLTPVRKPRPPREECYESAALLFDRHPIRYTRDALTSPEPRQVPTPTQERQIPEGLRMLIEELKKPS